MKITLKSALWLGSGLMLVIFVAASSLWTFRQAENAAQTRGETRLVLSKADDLLSALKDAETGERGYLLTGDEEFLQPYLMVKDSITTDLAELRQITLIEASRTHLDTMSPLVDAKLAELALAIDLHRKHSADAALNLVKGGDGKRLMDAIRVEMKSFIRLQDDFALRSDEQFLSKMRYLFGVIVAASLLVLSSAIAFAILILRQSQHRLKQLVYQETRNLLTIQEQTSERLQLANTTLQISEEKLAVTLNSIGDGVIATDADGRVTLLNRQAQKLTGWTQLQAKGQLIDDVFHILHQETRLPALVPVKETLAQGTEQALANHTVLIARGGCEYPIADSCAPIRDRESNVVGAVLVFRDVTEEYAVQQALHEKNVALEIATETAEKANLAKSEFLATMSHEIRTPMNGVIGMIDVLQQSSLNTAQVEMTNIIHDSAFALLAVINDILDFSKIEANKLETEAVPMSVCTVVESACDNMSQMALKKEVHLSLFIDPTIPERVLGDAGRIRQILINLTNNAIKFSADQPHPGRVAVRVLLTHREQNSVVLTFHVIDNGIGIDSDTGEKLFTAFTQADTSTTRKFGGSGLGLAISGQLAKLMGGDISVHSEPGKGSDFSVCLPFGLVDGYTPDDVTQSAVAGLSCLVMASTDGMADDVAAYLSFDQALVSRADDTASAHQWMVAHPDGVCVVFDHGDADPVLAALREKPASHPDDRWHFVSIGQGQRRRPRVDGLDSIMVDGNLLTRRTLIETVAIASGRADLPDWNNFPPDFESTVKHISREDARKQGCLILVAEDNEYNQKVIAQQLMLLGRAADITGNGQEALRRWYTGSYSILITDLHMPVMDGYELTNAIRAAEQGGPRMPIIAFTANALKGEAERCKAVGMDDYLSKPVQLVQLKEMLNKWQPVVLSDAFLSQSQPAVDVRVLAALIGNDEAVIGEFLNDFRVSAMQIAAELRTACLAGDALPTAAAAHKLKSAARSVGAMALGDFCAAMEKTGRLGDRPALWGLLPGFEVELARVESFLVTY